MTAASTTWILAVIYPSAVRVYEIAHSWVLDAAWPRRVWEENIFSARPQITRLSLWSSFWGAAGPAGTAGWRGRWQILGWGASPADCSDATRGTAGSGTWRTPGNRGDTAAFSHCHPAGSQLGLQAPSSGTKHVKSGEKRGPPCPKVPQQRRKAACTSFTSHFYLFHNVQNQIPCLCLSQELLAHMEWEFGISCLASGC